ncbi:WAP four-disulfide core domain protein 3-like isoform X2 [Delphinus delphis]|uniref:WAP four-disulfide core domain protein 3-like isoform X2 n=1 Tax=Delphinus delphis TaxID=9728 RepID=UPI0028C3E9E3|nr:WAP four-disulfide core domain protein 3-like isoform X2 [Delphinus delphis]
MKTGTIFVLVAFIVRGLEVAYTARPTFGAICMNECSGDWDCEEGKECVEVGCARICTPQTNKGHCEIRCWKNWNCGARKWCTQKGCRKVCHGSSRGAEQRPGTCPQLAPGVIGACVEMCSGDESCPLGQKCCSHGCGHSCQRAVRAEEDFTIRLDDN